MSLTRALSSQLYFQDDLTHVKSWYIDGKHYQRTSEDWLKRQDANAKVGLPALEKDAIAKGFKKEDARVAFYRCVCRLRSAFVYAFLIQWSLLDGVFSTWL